MNTYTIQQINDTLKLIESTIINCERVQPKLKPGSPQLSLSKNRIKALNISKSLILNEDVKYTEDELEKAIVQVTSIKNKSLTGIAHASQGTGTYTRFKKIIDAMNIVLDYLQDAKDEK